MVEVLEVRYLNSLTISTFADILVAIGTIYLAYTTSKSTNEMIKQRTPDIKIEASTNYYEKYRAFLMSINVLKFVKDMDVINF